MNDTKNRTSLLSEEDVKKLERQAEEAEASGDWDTADKINQRLCHHYVEVIHGKSKEAI
jgi:hypothetical protein